MKKLLFIGTLFGAALFIWSACTPSAKKDIMRMIEDEARRQNRQINENELSDELDRFTPEQLSIFREYVRNFIARTPQAVYWIEKLRKITEINKKFWKDYTGIIFGT